MSAGLLVRFAGEHELRAALSSLRAAGIGEIETYTPKPIEGGRSIVPTVVLIAGIVGAAASFALQGYADTLAYPLDIGGRPNLSWPAFIPIALENGILAAVLAGFFGFLVVNRLPRLYEPIDETAAIRDTTRNGWCIAVRTRDPNHLRGLLRDLAPVQVEELP